jgi:hypothetical protein
MLSITNLYLLKSPLWMCSSNTFLYSFSFSLCIGCSFSSSIGILSNSILRTCGAIYLDLEGNITLSVTLTQYISGLVDTLRSHNDYDDFPFE